MKHALALAPLLLVGLASTARAEPPRAVLSTNLLDLARQTLGAGLDYQVASHAAIHGELGYDTRSYFDNDQLYDYRGGLQAALAARAFLGAPYNGPFVDAEVHWRAFGTAEICNTNPTDPVISMCEDGWHAWSPRLRVGWQVTLDSGLSLTAAVGAGYEWVSRDDGQAHDTSVLFVGALRVGFAF